MSRRLSRPIPVIAALCLVLGSSCAVYTVSRTDLEQGLKTNARTVKVTQLYRKQYKNGIDTVVCMDENGARKLKRVNADSKIRIYTRDNRELKYYVKSLYIYKDEFLIGERTKPKLYGPNYFPVKLSDIERIEVTGY